MSATNKNKEISNLDNNIPTVIINVGPEVKKKDRESTVCKFEANKCFKGVHVLKSPDENRNFFRHLSSDCSCSEYTSSDEESEESSVSSSSSETEESCSSSVTSESEEYSSDYETCSSTSSSIV